MPTDTDFANDLNLDSSDTAQITNRLRASVHFLTKIDTRLSHIASVLQPSPPPITPEMKQHIASIAALNDRIMTATRRLDELPVQPGLGDGG